MCQRIEKFVEQRHVGMAREVRVERRPLLEAREARSLRRSTVRITDVKANKVRTAAGLGLDARCELSKNACSYERRGSRQAWRALTHGFIVVCFARCLGATLEGPGKQTS